MFYGRLGNMIKFEFTNFSWSASGESPVGRNSASSGRITGSSEYGTGTVPQSRQWMNGIGVPQ